MLGGVEKSKGSQSDGWVWTVPLAAARDGRLWQEQLLDGALPKAADGGHGGTGRGQMLSGVADVWGKRLRLP